MILALLTDGEVIKGLLSVITMMGAGAIALVVYIWRERVKMYEEEKEAQRETTKEIKRSIKKLCDSFKDLNFRVKNLENGQQNV